MSERQGESPEVGSPAWRKTFFTDVAPLLSGSGIDGRRGLVQPHKLKINGEIKNQQNPDSKTVFSAQKGGEL